MDHTAGSDPRLARRLGAGLLIGAVALPLFVLAQIVAHARTDEADSWLFAYYGRQMLAGWELYGDYWDNKPPGIFWVNAAGLWLARGSYGGVIALCVAASAGVMALLYRCARRWFGGGVAAIGLVLAAVLLWMPLYRGGTNRPEVFVMFFDLAALWMYGQALAGDRRRTWLAAGALAGGSLIFKQTGVAAVAAILVHQAWLAVTSAPDRRRVVPRLAALAAGLVCTLSGAILVLGLTADLRWARFGIVDFVKLYAAAHAQGLPWPRWFGLREHLHNLALPLILAAAGLLMAAARQLDRRGERRAAPLPAPQTVPRSGAPRALPVLLLSWLAAATYLAFIGPNPAFHYVPTILPALLLLALWTLHEALPLPQRGSAQAILYRWIALLWMAYMLATPVAELSGAFLRARYAQREDPDPFSTRAALQFINGHSRPGDSIYVWDYAPRVYWEAGRPCPARFTTMLNVQQIGRFGQIIVDDVARSLAAAPPKVILIPWRRAQELAAGRDDALVDYRSLGTWLCAHYRPAVEDDPTSLLVLAPER